jgi:diacylglycerol kinase family enzyme
MRLAAVVANPTSVDAAGRRQLITRLLRERGWDEPLWYETTPEDPGSGQASAAVAAGAEVVLSCGGDGTVRAVAHALAGSGVPLGLLPAGTGNLLARNLGLPLVTEPALEVALGGDVRKIDLAVLDDGQHFAVMAGMGFDAAMLAATPKALKARIGWPAYLVGIARSLRERHITVRLALDEGPELRRRVRGLLVGNVGRLQGGVPLLPDAEPDDGVLDVVALAPRSIRDWLVVLFFVLTRHHRPDPRLERFRARRVRIRTEREHACQLDGDVLPRLRRDLDISLVPGALAVRVPAATRGPHPPEATG